jgi:hypothetical protein
MLEQLAPMYPRWLACPRRVAWLLATLAIACGGDPAREYPDGSLPDAEVGVDAPGSFAWNEVTTSPAPSPRVDHAMAYDPQRGVVVLYGGSACGGGPGCSDETILDDLWEWDGTRWTESIPVGTTPGPRTRHALVYDPTRGKVVLIGGEGACFGWDGQTWEEIVIYCNAGCPSPQLGIALAYHAGWGRIVSFSSSGASFQIDGNAWRGLPDSGGVQPGARRGASLAYDPIRDVIWLFGGRNSNDTYPNDVWRLDDTGWHQHRMEEVPGATAPWGRRFGSLHWHPALSRLILFGGWSTDWGIGQLATPLDLSQWLWDGTTWDNQDAWSSTAAARYRHAAVYAAKDNKLVQFGGMNATDFATNSTFVFEGQ